MRHASLLALLLVAACSTGGEDEGTDPSQSPAPAGGARVVANVVAGRSLGDGRNGLLASTSATSLRSLKYAVMRVELCEDLQRNGSGFSNPTGCFPIFENGSLPSDPDFYPNYVVSSALADTTPDRYVDLMTPEGQGVLRDPAGLIPAGTYRYGLITFLRPIRITAEFPIVGGAPGEVVRTRAVSTVQPVAGPDGFPLERVLIGDTRSAAPAEETTYMLNNGGAFFAFASPFVITKEEADAGVPITVDLVFNPENFGQVFDGPPGGCTDATNTAICDPANNLSFDMPFVRMSPVPRKLGEETRKEVYLVDYDGAPSDSQLRVELYYNGADPEKTVRGVDVALVYLPTATAPTLKAVDGSMLTQEGSVADGSARVTLQDYAGEPNLSGLARGRDGTVTLTCRYTGGTLCPELGREVELPCTFVGDELVSAD